MLSFMHSLRYSMLGSLCDTVEIRFLGISQAHRYSVF